MEWAGRAILSQSMTVVSLVGRAVARPKGRQCSNLVDVHSLRRVEFELSGMDPVRCRSCEN
jgi:hypothetical protein